MHILITGAAGMIGRKLAERLARDGGLDGQRIDKVTLLDVAPTIKGNASTGRAMGEKPERHGFVIDKPGAAPALARHMSMTGG